MAQGNNQDVNVLFFDGVKIFMANGLASDKMVATTKDNLWFGTGLLSDSQEVRVLDMADLDGSQNVRVIMRFTAGVQYGVAADIVTYGIA
jgi:prepilin-type processing-associated H-X9-DG protein